MWHKIWDTAATFHQRYIRPVWIRVHYSKLQEVIDDDGEIEEFLKNGDRRSHLPTTSQVVIHYGSTSKYCTNTTTNNNSTSLSRSTSLKNEEFDQVDAGFARPTITFPVVESVGNKSEYPFYSMTTTDSVFKGSSSSCLKNNNSTVTDLKHAIQFQPKRPSYRLVQEEGDRIEVISVDHHSPPSLTSSSSKRRNGDRGHRKSSHHLQQQKHNHHNPHQYHHNHHQSTIPSFDQNNMTVEEITQSSNNNGVLPNAKKSKSRRKKIKKKLGRSARVSMHFLKEAFILGFTPPAPCLYFTGP